jgi:two-component system cell cycle response regulator
MTDSTPPRLLLIEDDPDTAALMGEILRQHFGGDCVRSCSTISQARAVDPREVDLVLSDMNLPDGTGLDALADFLERRPDLPIVLVTAELSAETAVAAVRRGAYDYVVKTGEYLLAIGLVVEKNLAIWRVKQDNQRLAAELRVTLAQVQVKNRQLEEAVRMLETVAATDPLTNLANRRAFGFALDRSYAEAARYGHDLACIMIDLDGFKQFNDACGHLRGDDLLRLLSRVLEANCRRSDVAGRYGGDEFILLMPQTDLATAQLVAGRIMEQFQQALVSRFHLGPGAGMSLSMGLSTLRNSRPATGEDLVGHADHALYSAKQSGKGCLRVYQSATGTPTDSTPAVVPTAVVPT